MTIFRFRPARVAVAKALALVGLFGFLACMGYEIVVGRQLFGDDQYRTATLERAAPVSLKGVRFFVDERTAKRLKTSENAALPIFLMGILAGLYLQRLERRENRP
jgi:hypothetical protein